MKFEVVVEIEESKKGWLREMFDIRDMDWKGSVLHGEWVDSPKKLARLEREAISKLNKILSNEGLVVHQIKRLD